MSVLVLGLIPSPFDCYQVLRGMRTLHIRMQSHLEKSLTVANFLETQDFVEKVNHPGKIILNKSGFKFYQHVLNRFTIPSSTLSL